MTIPTLRLVDGSIDTVLHDLHARSDALLGDITRLSAHVDHLLAERQRIIDVLNDFYRSDLSISSLQPVLDLCTTLNPQLRFEGRR